MIETLNRLCIVNEYGHRKMNLLHCVYAYKMLLHMLGCVSLIFGTVMKWGPWTKVLNIHSLLIYHSCKVINFGREFRKVQWTVVKNKLNKKSFVLRVIIPHEYISTEGRAQENNKMFHFKKPTKSVNSTTEKGISSIHNALNTKESTKIILDTTRWEASSICNHISDVIFKLSHWSLVKKFGKLEFNQWKMHIAWTLIYQNRIVLVSFHVCPTIAAITKRADVIDQRATTRSRRWCR